ncbi:hypothetical protein [Nocardia xishanensis]
MPDEDWFVVQFEPDDEDGGIPYVRMPVGIDLFEILETLKSFYVSCMDDPVLRAKYFQAPAISEQLEKLGVLRSLDLDVLKAEAARNPVMRDWIIGMIHEMVHNLRSDLPITLLANIVALELMRTIDDSAITQLRTLDHELKSKLLERLEYLIGDGFEGARERIVHQVHEQVYRG